MPTRSFLVPAAVLGLAGLAVAGAVWGPGLVEQSGLFAGSSAAAPSQTMRSSADAADESDERAHEQHASDPAVQAQLDYVLAYWSDYNLDDYGMLDDNDCVNFTSQSLIARGWEMDEDWWTEGTGVDFDYTTAWVSSTSFMRYLETSDRVRELSESQRDQVKLGDIVQFDWDDSGDRDHTGIVTAIEGSGDDLTIYYAGHTDDTEFRSVDVAITEIHPGGRVYYWSVL